MLNQTIIPNWFVLRLPLTVSLSGRQACAA
jgi:hypothetical protein